MPGANKIEIREVLNALAAVRKRPGMCLGSTGAPELHRPEPHRPFDPGCHRGGRPVRRRRQACRGRDDRRRSEQLVEDLWRDRSAYHLAVPSLSNASTATSVGSVTSLTWSHTAEAGKPIYVIIGTNSGDITDTGTITCTFGGVAMVKKFEYKTVILGFHVLNVFTLTSPTAGAANISYSITTAATPMSAIAFNVADGGVNGDVILPLALTTGTTGASGNAPSWHAGGLQVVFAYSSTHSDSVSITQGTNLTTGGGTALNHLTTTNGTLALDCTGAAAQMSLLTFFIPPASDSLASGTYQHVFGGPAVLALLDGDVLFYGLPYGGEAIGSPNGGRGGVAIPAAGTWHSVAVRLSEPVPAGVTLNFEIYRGGGSFFQREVPTGITWSIPEGEQSVTVNGLDFTNYKYERLLVRMSPTGGDISLTVSGMTWLRECGIADHQIYGGGNKSRVGTSTSVEYAKAPLHPLNAQWGDNASPNTNKSLWGIDSEIAEVVYEDFGASSPTVDPSQHFLVLNGTLQDGSGGSTDTTLPLVQGSIGYAMARWQGSFAVGVGDLVGHAVYQQDAGFGDRDQACCILVIPTTTGRSMVSGATTNSTGDYANIVSANGGGASTGQEDEVQLVIPPLGSTRFTAEDLIADLDGDAPGSGKTLDLILRKNSADSGLHLPIADAATNGQTDGSVSVPYVEDDLIGIIWDALNAPTQDRQFWSLVIGASVVVHRGVIGPHQFIKFPTTIPDAPT